jgi:hypothetical protein
MKFRVAKSGSPKDGDIYKVYCPQWQFHGKVKIKNTSYDSFACQILETNLYPVNDGSNWSVNGIIYLAPDELTRKRCYKVR